MAKVITDAMLDGGLDKTITCVRLTVCAGQPTSYADIAVRALATHTLTGGDWSKANGDTSGRKATMAAQNDILIDTSGTADHVVVDTGAVDQQYLVTTCTAVALVANASNTVSVPTWDQEFADPT